MAHNIVIKGARVHNLKNISVTIPRDQLPAHQRTSGQRLQPQIVAMTVHGYNIIELTKLSIEKLHQLFKDLKLNSPEQVIGERLVKEITNKVASLDNVGLGYLSHPRTIGLSFWQKPQ